MAKHKIMPLPDASVGRVLGLVEVLYSYGGSAKVSFLSEELKMDMDELGSAIDMGELFGLMKVKDGMTMLTIYGEAVSLGTVDDKKRILRKRISEIEPFRTAVGMLKGTEYVREGEVITKISERYPIADREKFHKLFVGWGTYAGVFEYNSRESTFSVPQKRV
ncbi:MAG: AAA-associated domain-containing protein [Candidatus ainarchaeum sp.]|nr:AAA-associated domain-containing protein [Candidatus ainarchaeum sp.]